MDRRSPRRMRALPILALLAVVLTACSGLGGTGDLDYVAGDGNVVQIAPSDRDDPVDVSGPTLDGDRLALADLRGQVVVVNVWGSWCGPCRSEAPLLARASRDLDAEFVGIDIRDTIDNAASFEREFGIDYPSIYDEGGETLLRFGKHAPTQATPSTAVLDKTGRVAAIIVGEIPSATTLKEIVAEVAAEDGPS